jgi:peptidoglycan LD-endopeptidase LytH
VGERSAVDLHTAAGLFRTGMLAGVVLVLVFFVLARMAKALRKADGSARAMAAVGGPPQPLLFPLAGVDSTAIGEGFDARRGGRRHEAVDIAAPRHTPVRAAADGMVRLTKHAGAGLTVEQDETSGRFCLVYAHLAGYAPGLRDLDAVARGQTIGYVGTTGNAPAGAPHLHFAVHSRAGGGCWSGAAVDPVPLFGP